MTRKSWNSGLKNDDKCHEIAIKAWETRRANGTAIPWNKNLKGAQIAWNKDLTKEFEVDSEIFSISPISLCE